MYIHWLIAVPFYVGHSTDLDVREHERLNGSDFLQAQAISHHIIVG